MAAPSLGSRLHWQVVHSGAGLCHDMDTGCSGARHKQCCEHVAVPELFVIMIFLSMMCLLPAACICSHCSSHEFKCFCSAGSTEAIFAYHVFHFQNFKATLWHFLGEGSLNFQENVHLLFYYFGVHFLFALWLNCPL